MDDLVGTQENLTELTQSSSTNNQKSKPKFDPNKNHGRYSANDYSGCDGVSIEHPDLKAGDCCPACEEEDTRGVLYSMTPSTIIKLKGSPLIAGTRYELARLRCSFCGNYYVASLPDSAAKLPKYDETCRSSIAIARYYAGQPFHRIEQLQESQGIPMADATQWDLVSKLYYDSVKPIHSTLEQMASNGQLMHYDDTGNRILEAYGQKRGVHTTSFISMCGTHPIYLFFTSMNTAGKNQEELLKNRTTEESLMTMTDASSQNIPKYMDESLLARWILCLCLVHGRRKFHEIRHLFSKPCEFVLNTIGAIYYHEDHCKKHQLSPQARLEYHQTHSAPLMEGLRVWLNNQLLHRHVEEHSSLGNAIRYMLKHWQGLTRFLHVPGAPIDNSICEQAIKVAIRHRRNSLFYRTFKSAQVGDGLMSIIHTAAKNHINIFDYLNTLQRHKEQVKVTPAQWLPWNYQQTLHRALAA